MITNLNKLVWDRQIPLSIKLQQLTEERSKLGNKITNRKKLSFDLYHVFPFYYDKLTDNNKWKELTLAIEVAKIIKRWDRMYKIDLKKSMSGQTFVNYFKDYIDTSKFSLCTVGINFYHRKGYTFKTFILWANKLCKLGIVSDIQFNSFMKYLEDISNEKR